MLFTVDHHHGSEENQAGWEHHDESVVDPRTGRMDTLPFFRRTIEDAGLEDAVVGVIGDSPTVGRLLATPVGLLFIDGGHADDVAMADYVTWAGFVAPGGVLAIHDVFEDPADGGQAPFRVWQRAVADGFDAGLDHRQPPHPPPLTGRRRVGESRQRLRRSAPRRSASISAPAAISSSRVRPTGRFSPRNRPGGRARRRTGRARRARRRRSSTSAGRG